MTQLLGGDLDTQKRAFSIPCESYSYTHMEQKPEQLHAEGSLKHSLAAAGSLQKPGRSLPTQKTIFWRVNAYTSLRGALAQEQGLLKIPVSCLYLKTTQICSWAWGEKSYIHKVWFGGKHIPLKIISPTKPIPGLKFSAVFTDDSI